MKMLSVGIESTLGNWLGLSQIVFGKNSKQARYFEAMIRTNPRGEHDEVLADESQLLHVLASMEDVEDKPS